MAAIKCVKCGANIPKGARFCPACGAPKAEEQPTSLDSRLYKDKRYDFS